MASGIKIDLLTDTSELKRGFKTAEDALEDVSDALDDVAKDGEAAGERLEKSFSDVAQSTKREARDMGKEISKSYDKAADDAGEATQQMADDGFSNAKEVAASFDGSAESIVDGFQGAAAEMFSGFGPAGAAAGLAAAAGLGLMTAELEKQKERASEVAQATWDMAQEMVDAGRYVFTEEMKTNLLREWLGDEDEQKRVAKYIDDLGISAAEFGTGLFDIGDKREELEKRIRDVYGEQRDALGDLTEGSGRRYDLIGNIEAAEKNIREVIKEQDDIMGLTVTKALEFNEALTDAGIHWEPIELSAKETYEHLNRISEMDATPEFRLEDPLRQAQSIYDILKKASQIKLPTTRDIR